MSNFVLLSTFFRSFFWGMKESAKIGKKFYSLHKKKYFFILIILPLHFFKGNTNLSKNTVNIEEARKKYNSYDSNIWGKNYFDESTGGFVVIHKGHKFDIVTGKYEKDTAKILAKNGFSIEMMDESNFEKP